MPPRNCQRTSGWSSLSLSIGRSTRIRSPRASRSARCDWKSAAGRDSIAPAATSADLSSIGHPHQVFRVGANTNSQRRVMTSGEGACSNRGGSKVCASSKVMTYGRSSSSFNWLKQSQRLQACPLPSPADEREHGALWVLGLDDPTAARHLHRAVDDLAATGLCALHRRLVEHAADWRPTGGEDLIGAHGAHVHRVSLLPSK